MKRCIPAIVAVAMAIVSGAPALSATGSSMRQPAETESASLATAKPMARPASLPGYECSRIRRKLWVEGEGWIVRRVAICR